MTVNKGVNYFYTLGSLLWYVDCLLHRKFFYESLSTVVDTVLLGRAGLPPLNVFEKRTDHFFFYSPGGQGNASEFRQ
jgi:hypothetical protein